MIYPLDPSTPILDSIPDWPASVRPLPQRTRSWACLGGAEHCGDSRCQCLCHAQPSLAWPAAFVQARDNASRFEATCDLSRWRRNNQRPAGPALADLIATRTRRVTTA